MHPLSRDWLGGQRFASGSLEAVDAVQEKVNSFDRFQLGSSGSHVRVLPVGSRKLVSFPCWPFESCSVERFVHSKGVEAVKLGWKFAGRAFLDTNAGVLDIPLRSWGEAGK